MGFLDKLFKRKKDVADTGKTESVKKASAPAKAECKADVKKCSSDYGKSQLGVAMTKAVSILNDREKAGTMKPAIAGSYRARIEGMKSMIGTDEEAGLLQISQIIGSINRSL
jgi:hypothetical protein